jgi:hypothetical protein
MQIFDAFLNNLESQLTSYIEKQRITHLFIKFRSKLRAALIVGSLSESRLKSVRFLVGESGVPVASDVPGKIIKINH